MKRYLFVSAIAAMALASCSSDDFLGDAQGNTPSASSNKAISFRGDAGKITRVDNDLTDANAATALGNNFVVVGYKYTGTESTKSLVFDHYNVNYVTNTANTTASNTKNWEYVNQALKVKGIESDGKLAGNNVTSQTIKYWDNSASSYDFLAFSMGKGNTTSGNTTYATPTKVNWDKLSSEAYSFSGDLSTLGECYFSDITTVKKGEKGFGSDAVKMTFRHATSKIRIALYETVPGYVISDVKFHNNAYSNGNYTEGSEEGQLYGKFYNQGKITVFFPKTGSENKSDPNYNKASVKVTTVNSSEDSNTPQDISKSFGKVNYGNQKEDAIVAGTTYLSQSAASPSYCGTSPDYYQNVLPADEDNSHPASIRIDYKLTATDGSGEVINVKNATATIPAAYTAWKSGYAYTYVFQISKNTNGTTGTPGSDDAGLTAISFDAVVAKDETLGNQETNTNVAECSITTYGVKDNKVTTNADEYPAEADIYATAYIPEHSCSVTEEKDKGEFRAPNNLYTVTLDNGAAQTINETSVLNAIKNGTKDPTDNPTSWTVMDANGKKLTVTKVTNGTESVTSVPTEDSSKTLTVNALKWKGTANTTYFVEYNTTCTKKAYKIVKVAASTTEASN